MNEAQRLAQKLNQVSRQLYRRGYGIPQLVFSDLSSVSSTDWTPGPMEEIEVLLQAGKEPLGFIAPPRDRRSEPFVATFRGREEACDELRSLAHLWYRHRM